MEVSKMKSHVSILFFLLIIFFITGCKKDQEKPNPTPSKRPKMELKVEGGEVVQLKGKEAGLPLETIPGIKSITFEEWLKMKEVPKTGLFLVDTDFIPNELLERLKKEGYQLRKDGTFDSAGVQIALFIQAEVFERLDKNEGALNFPDLKKLLSLFVKPVYAADPFPLRRISWNMWWRYNGGFCRDWRAGTLAEAWGPLQEGVRPHTRIDTIKTHAELGSGLIDRDVCIGCDQGSSYVQYDVGCFWPASGCCNGFHFAIWQDGSFSATRTWRWTP
jgi:hypothetical protein